jgi:hypothetical protein
MYANKKHLRTATMFLATLLLFQSCVVYHRTPTTLERASEERIRTKVTNSIGEDFKYKYIIYEDGVYFGVTKESGELVKAALGEQQIAKVVLKNKTVSTVLTVVVLTPVAFFLFGIIYCASGGNCVDISE